MNVMDCRDFKELLDSYLCGELAVETNHTMLGHAERCCPCRSELAARRQLRESLRRVCSREKMSDQAMESLRARLRSEATERMGNKTGWRNWFVRFFEMRSLIPAAIVAGLLFLIGGAWGLYVLRRGDINDRRTAALSPEHIKALELSASLIDETASDHRTCAPYFINATKPAEMPNSVREYDPACVRLDKVAAEGAMGLTLRAAHVCGHGERKFAHLVYTRDGQLISLLVTVRDSRALKAGEVPPFDGLALDAQRFTYDHLALGAYQTARHIVFVVSELPENENTALAERLAKPVINHLRSAELSSIGLNRIKILREREK